MLRAMDRHRTAILLVLLAFLAGAGSWAVLGKSQDERYGYYTPLGGRPSDDVVIDVVNLSYTAQEYRASAGLVRVTLRCRCTAALMIDEVRGFQLVTAGGGATRTVKLRPGTYWIGSPIPGHRAAGQEAVLVVEDSN